MTRSQHTPGPWAVSPYMNITSRNGTVAKTEQMPGNDDSEREANAHLIAAAPDLLAVAELAKDLMENIQFNDYLTEHEQALLDSALAAIAKAEGRTK